MIRRLSFAIAGVAGLTACGGGAPAGPAPALPLASLSAPQRTPPVLEELRDPARGKIQHVIIIVQENRELQQPLLRFPRREDGKVRLSTPAVKRSRCSRSASKRPGTSTTARTRFLPPATAPGSIPGTNCRMNGFNNEYVGCGGRSRPPCPNPNPTYSYVPHTETKPYFEMAKQYVLADQMFASNFDASSFISHQYIISGQAESAVNYPDGAWGCPGGSGDKISRSDSSVRFRRGTKSCAGIRRPSETSSTARAFRGDSTPRRSTAIWVSGAPIRRSTTSTTVRIGRREIITPQTQVFNDLSNGNLPAVSWITPTWENSDHAGSGSKTGPSWVDVAGQRRRHSRSIGTRPPSSSSGTTTADGTIPVAPAFVDYDGLGLRLPMLIISPYAKKGLRVSRPLRARQHSAIHRRPVRPRTAVGQRCAGRSPESDAFDFTQPPRKFKVIPAKYGKDFFLHQPTSHYPPDTE